MFPLCFFMSVQTSSRSESECIPRVGSLFWWERRECACLRLMLCTSANSVDHLMERSVVAMHLRLRWWTSRHVGVCIWSNTSSKIYVLECTYPHTSMRMHACISRCSSMVHIYVSRHNCMSVCMCISIYFYINIHLHISHVCIHIGINIFTYTYTYTQHIHVHIGIYIYMYI